MLTLNAEVLKVTKSEIMNPIRRAGLKVIAALVASVLCVAPGYADTNDDDHGKEAVERRQKIEIDRFYAGNDGKAPVAPMAIGLYNDAVKFFEKNEFELARDALNESLALEPRNALAFELLGEIENLQQNFEKAEKYYKQGYLVSPSTRLRCATCSSSITISSNIQ